MIHGSIIFLSNHTKLVQCSLYSPWHLFHTILFGLLSVVRIYYQQMFWQSYEHFVLIYCVFWGLTNEDYYRLICLYEAHICSIWWLHFGSFKNVKCVLVFDLGGEVVGAFGDVWTLPSPNFFWFCVISGWM